MFLFLLSVVLASPPQTTIHAESGVYGKTVSRWAEIVSSSTDESTVTLIRKLQLEDKRHKNLSRDYIIWMSKGALTQEGKTIGIVWFHGHTGFSERTFKKRIVNQFKDHLDKNFFVVIPEMPWSWNTNTRTSRNGQIWKKPGEFVSFIEMVKQEVEKYGVSSIDWRVIGHSAGGSTLASVGASGDLCLIEPSRIIWSDSSYGWWLEKATSGCLQDFVMDVHVTHHESKTSRAAARFMKSSSGKRTRVHRERLSHMLIGDRIVKLSGVLNEN